MARREFICAHCGAAASTEAGAINRAAKKGAILYCGRVCSGLGRRINKTTEQKRAEKAAYDAQYRAKNRARLIEGKRAYHKRTYDPVKAAEYRQCRMPYHVKYCQQASYREWKREYDANRRASEYGPFAAVYQHLLQIEHEVRQRASWYEVAMQKGTFNKHQKRRREYDRLDR